MTLENLRVPWLDLSLFAHVVKWSERFRKKTRTCGLRGYDQEILAIAHSEDYHHASGSKPLKRGGPSWITWVSAERPAFGLMMDRFESSLLRFLVQIQDSRTILVLSFSVVEMRAWFIRG